MINAKYDVIRKLGNAHETLDGLLSDIRDTTKWSGDARWSDILKMIAECIDSLVGIRVLVCGGRDFIDKDFVFRTLDETHDARLFNTVISGGARGADKIAEQWAMARRISFIKYPANWPKHGKGAGLIRNETMLRDGRPNLVIAFPGGRGTAHMVKIAKASGVQVQEF